MLTLFWSAPVTMLCSTAELNQDAYQTLLSALGKCYELKVFFSMSAGGQKKKKKLLLLGVIVRCRGIPGGEEECPASSTMGGEWCCMVLAAEQNSWTLI